jgi:hypothetical protein
MLPNDRLWHFGIGNEFSDRPWWTVHLSSRGTVHLDHDCLRGWSRSSVDIDLRSSARDESSSVADHSRADRSTDLGSVCSCGLVHCQIDACPRRNCGGRHSQLGSIRLEFYGLDWSNHSGRYLVVKNAAGEARQGMSAFDWTHWPRTSIYLIGDGRVAVLGPTYDDYVVDPKRRTIDSLWHGTRSDTWTYFGAFDFKDRKLMFIPASEQRECTATRGHNRSIGHSAPRAL